MTGYTERVLDDVSRSVIAIAPRLLLYEIHNATLMGLRRRRIDPADAEEFLGLFSNLPIQIVDPPSYRAVFALAQRHSLTIYDATYLDLALSEGLPITSVDKNLVRAADHAGIPIFKAERFA